MILEKLSAEQTKGFTSGLPSSLVAAACLITLAVIAGGLLILTFNFPMIGRLTYDTEAMKSLTNFGVESNAFY